MRVRFGTALSVGALGLAVLGGCSDNRACTSGCPDVSGTFELTTNVPAGQCEFQPYLLPPNIRLDQAAGSGEVVTTIIDPVQQLEFAITGTLFTDPDADRDLVAAFLFQTRPTRQPQEGATLTMFQLQLTGSVFQKPGESVRQLSGQFIQTQISDGAQVGCSVSQSFNGIRR